MKLCSQYVRNILPSVTHVDPRDAILFGAPVEVYVIINTMLHCQLKEFWRLAERLKNLDTRDLLCSEKLF